MKTRNLMIVAMLICVCLIAYWYRPAKNTENHLPKNQEGKVFKKVNLTTAEVPDKTELATYAGTSPFILKGIDWLAASQFENGGWGAGSNNRQHIRDPKAVKVDPGTTAFAAMALLRAGNTLKKGPHSENLKKALMYLLQLIEEYPAEGPKITNITGTQPQVKLGQNIDASLCAQFLMRIKSHTRGKLAKRIDKSLGKCLKKIQGSLAKDGSIRGGGWAPVLQSAMANNTLEMAYDAGLKVDKKALERSRDYQKKMGGKSKGGSRPVSTFGRRGMVSSPTYSKGDAGVALYSISSQQRATAKEAKKAEKIIKNAIRKGKLNKDAKINADNLNKVMDNEDDAKKLSQAYEQNEATYRSLQSNRVLAGFGNNGGEEFLSYMMTSESMVINGEEKFDKWQAKMLERLEKIQNPNGSWSGHHCITSPVFCTAAVVLTLTVEKDKDMLVKERKKD
ncbi:MAG TPA: hypothetical protein DCS93_32000 [Microscillaceae bacterium]|nr:hypothetical protein [Microscillaceae bacterium]